MITVTGAGGFIGHHLVKALKAAGCEVRGVDLKHPEFEPTAADEFLLLDLRRRHDAVAAVAGASEVYALAATMGGMGYIPYHDAEIMRDNLLIDINTLDAAASEGCKKLVYTSSACVYSARLQQFEMHSGLKETDVEPIAPQHGYGWEKLTAEKILEAYRKAGRIDVRIARLHAIYGPLGTWKGGREKAPAAICRKVAEAPAGGKIEVWGDGRQGRSFCYIDDAIDGLLRLARSDHREPLNIGSSTDVSIDHLASLAIAASGKGLGVVHIPGPQGVRGRNSDNTLCRRVLGWEPEIRVEEGIPKTYAWVASQVAACLTS